MKETYDFIVYIYLDLSSKGFNLIAIILTVFLIDFLKNKVFSNYKWYKKNHKDIIILSFGLIISFIFAIVFYRFDFIDNWYSMIITTITGFALTVLSKNIVKAIYKIIPGKQEGEDEA